MREGGLGGGEGGVGGERLIIRNETGLRLHNGGGA